MIHKKTIPIMPKKDIFLFFLISLFFAWLWFLPVFWSLSQGSTTYTSALYKVFFSTQEREMFYGDTLDLQGTIWVFYHFDRILSGESTSFLSEIYAPFGFDLGKHTGFGWGDALLSWPIIKWLGIPGFYNLHVLLTLTLSYFGCMLLYRTVGASRLISIALAFASCSTTFFRQELLSGRPTQIHWFFHCVFLIAIYKLMYKKSSVQWAVVGGIFGAWACFVYWFGGAAIGFCGAILLLFTTVWQKHKIQRFLHMILLGSITLFLAISITARISIPLLMGEGGSLYPQLETPPAYVATIAGYSIPIQEFIAVKTKETFLHVLAQSMIPYELLRMVFFALFIPFAWNKRIVWLLVGIIAIGIPIGPALQWEGGWIPTGYSLLHSVFPPLPRCGFNHRMVVAPILILGVFMAISTTSLLDKIRSPVERMGISLLVAVLIAAPSYKEIPNYLLAKTSYLSVDRTLQHHARQNPGGIIHIPIERSGGSEHIQQMFHKQPILNGPGMDTIREKSHRSYCAKNSILSAMEYMSQYKVDSIPLHEKADLNTLYNDGFRFFYLEKQRVLSDTDAFLRLLGTKNAFDSGQYIMIPIPKPQ